MEMGMDDLTGTNGSPAMPRNSPDGNATIPIREQSTVNQLKLVEQLFVRLNAMYGRAFQAMWIDSPIAEVKALWAEKLGGFSVQQIGAALGSMDERPYPPNLPEFLALCRQRSRDHRDAAESSAFPSPAQAQSRAQELGALKVGKAMANRDWAHKIVAQWDAGQYSADWQYGYGLACKAIAVAPKPHPSKSSRTRYRADIDA